MVDVLLLTALPLVKLDELGGRVPLYVLHHEQLLDEGAGEITAEGLVLPVCFHRVRSPDAVTVPAAPQCRALAVGKLRREPIVEVTGDALYPQQGEGVQVRKDVEAPNLLRHGACATPRSHVLREKLRHFPKHEKKGDTAPLLLLLRVPIKIVFNGNFDSRR